MLARSSAVDLLTRFAATIACFYQSSSSDNGVQCRENDFIQRGTKSTLIGTKRAARDIGSRSLTDRNRSNRPNQRNAHENVDKRKNEQAAAHLHFSLTRQEEPDLQMITKDVQRARWRQQYREKADNIHYSRSSREK